MHPDSLYQVLIQEQTGHAQRPNYGQYPNAYIHGVSRFFGQSPPSTPTQHNGTLWSDEFFFNLSDVYFICINLLIN